MKSPSVVPRGVQTPRVRHAPQVRSNAWEDVADVARAYGLLLDEWQENVLEAAMGERTDGQWASPRVGISVPRQNGKGALIEARELAGLLVFGEQSIVHSAHQQSTARVGFDRLKAYFENYDDLRRKVKAVGTAVAREYIQLKSGQMIRFPARSKTAIRGYSVDLLILDEAQIFGEAALQAVMPTMSARTNPQMWLLGTPPTPTDDGTVFMRWRNDGLEGKDRRLCWVEWSADNDSDLDDRDVWAAANPALGYRITYEAVMDERAALDDDGFGRERLGMWDSAAGNSVIDPKTWEAAADQSSTARDRLSLAVDISPNREAASVALAGQRADGRWHVELDEHRNGTGWIVPWIAARVERNDIRAVVVDGASAAGSILDELQQRKIRVTTTSAQEMAAACGSFYDGIMDSRVVHIDQPQLSHALGVARKRPMLGGAAWGWNRKNPTSDITPVVAATLALWGAQNSNVKRPARRRSTTDRRAVVL